MFKQSFLVGMILLALILVACDQTATPERDYTKRQILDIEASLDAFGRQELARSPETASRLGILANAGNPNYLNQLDDRSQAAFERTRLARLEVLEKIGQIDAAALPNPVKTSLTVAQAALTSAVEMATFGHGQISLGFSRPYTADQLSGAYIDLPDLLINRQNIRNRTEALAYIERLAGISNAIDDDRRRLMADADVGVIPPDFILQRMATLSRQLRQIPENGKHPIFQAFENLSIGAGNISPEDRARMLLVTEDLIKDDLVPAYQRFEETLDNLINRASEAPGIWTIKNGDDYYKAALRFYIGQNVPPATLHEDGLQTVAIIAAELDIALQEAGFSQGTITERLIALNQVPGQVFTNDAEGRAALLAALNDRLRETQPLLAKLIENPPQTNVAIAEVPAFLSANAPGGYYAAAPANQSAPGTFYINLRNTDEWPAYSLPTLLYHETVPGHHLESAISGQRANLSNIRQLIWLPVYGEGWALYAEDLANELGVYKDDPLGQVGYLQSLLFRAARMVTDTGIHYQRWSRDRAVTYLVETTGQPRSAMETEVDRYAVWPGQAVSYMVGRQFIWKMRQRSQDALGDRFSRKSFHDVILTNGPRTLELVEADIEAWIKTEAAKP